METREDFEEELKKDKKAKRGRRKGILDGGAGLDKEPEVGRNPACTGYLHEHMNFILSCTCFTRSFYILFPT